MNMTKTHFVAVRVDQQTYDRLTRLGGLFEQARNARRQWQGRNASAALRAMIATADEDILRAHAENARQQRQN